MESPEFWRWIWLVGAAGFVVGEIAVAGTFFLLPFAIGAALACALAFGDVGLGWQWLVFVGASAVSLGALYPLRHRLDRDEPMDGIGARRLLGQQGRVIEALEPGPGGKGLVLVGREEWRADTLDGEGLPVGAIVKVVDVRGTRVIVFPVRAIEKES